MKPPADKSKIETIARSAILVAAIFLGYLAWVDAAHLHALALDDLWSFSMARRGVFAFSHALVPYFRFRPIGVLIMCWSAQLTGGQFDELLLVGVGLQTLNTFLVWRLLAQTLQIPPGMALALTAMVAFNRFTAFGVSPCLAIWEGSALTFYLLTLWALIRLTATARRSFAVAFGVFFLVDVHIHERYLVAAAGGLVAAALVYRRCRSASIISTGASVAVVVLNCSIKRWVLHTPILIGAGVAPIHFEAGSILHFFGDGMANMAGINLGPSYLSLRDYTASPEWLRMISLASGVLSVAVLGYGAWCLRPAVKSPPPESAAVRRTATLLGCLVVVLVLAGSVSVHQEYRWIYPAYVTFVMLLGCCARAGSRKLGRSGAMVALAGIVVFAVPREFAIREDRGNFYARYALEVANDLFVTAHRYPALLAAKEITISDNVPASSGIFLNGMFSQYYNLPPLRFVPEPAGRPAATGVKPMLSYDPTSRHFTYGALE